MHWQDLTQSLATLVLGAALIPAIMSKTKKPPISTSLWSAAALCLIGFTVASFGLWVALATTSLEIAGFLILAWQRWQLDHLSMGGSIELSDEEFIPKAWVEHATKVLRSH